MFERNLKELITGLRQASSEQTFLDIVFEEIKIEIKSANQETQSNAALKLTYLHMLGYRMEWAAFQILELMGSPSLSVKKIAYMAAINSFNTKTEILMLLTNLLKRDLSSSVYDEVALALKAISSLVITNEMTHQLIPELKSLLRHTKPFIRKRAILALFRMVQINPESWRSFEEGVKTLLLQSFSESSNLDNNAPPIINVILTLLCEICDGKDVSCLPFTPILYKIMETKVKQEPGLCIKIVKTVSKLVPGEPRLAKKFSNLFIEAVKLGSQSLSLMHATIKAVSETAKYWNTALHEICLGEIQKALGENDANLKYVALEALCHLLEAKPELFTASLQADLLRCTNNADSEIRLMALGITSKMATRLNFVSIVQRLCQQLQDESSNRNKNLVIEQVLAMGRRETYALVTNIEWYFGAILLDQLTIHATDRKIFQEIAFQMTDMTSRISEIRDFAVMKVIDFLSSLDMTLKPCLFFEIVCACCWIIGEYHHHELHHHQNHLHHRLVVADDNLIDNRFESFVKKVFTDCRWFSPQTSLDNVRFSLLTAFLKLSSSSSLMFLQKNFILGSAMEDDLNVTSSLMASFIHQIPDTNLPALAKLILSKEILPVPRDAQSQIPFPVDEKTGKSLLDVPFTQEFSTCDSQRQFIDLEKIPEKTYQIYADDRIPS